MNNSQMTVRPVEAVVAPDCSVFAGWGMGSAAGAFGLLASTGVGLAAGVIGLALYAAIC